MKAIRKALHVGGSKSEPVDTTAGETLCLSAMAAISYICVRTRRQGPTAPHRHAYDLVT